MKIDCRTVGPFEENSWLVLDEGSGRAVLIDPGDEPAVLIDMVNRNHAQLDAIWLTHAHLDHIGGIRGVRDRWRVPVHLHPLDRPLYDQVEVAAAMFGVDVDKPEPPDHELAEGQVMTVGSLSFDVLHVPGHSPGHVVFVGNGVILGGDLLFYDSIGRTDFPECDPAAMERSLDRIITLDHDLVVHPGHGLVTTIGRESAMNPFLTGAARPIRR